MKSGRSEGTTSRRLLGGCLIVLVATFVGVAPPSWSCSPPETVPPMVAFEGVALSSAPGEYSELWTFRVDPPVDGLSETVEVGITRSNTGDEASCTIAGPELIVGATYEIVAAQWSADSPLFVNTTAGSYRLLEAPPIPSEPLASPARSTPTTAEADREESLSSGWAFKVLLLVAAFGAIGAVVVSNRLARGRPT